MKKLFGFLIPFLFIPVIATAQTVSSLPTATSISPLDYLYLVTSPVTSTSSKKVTFQTTEQAIYASIGGNATINSGGFLTISNGAITNAMVGSGISATKIGAGTVTNTTYGYVSNVTSDIQAQLNSKLSSTRSINTTAPLAGGGNLTADRTLSISQASTSTDGYLSAIDWNTFNNKAAAGNYITALTGEVTASGPGSASATVSNASVIAKVLTGYTSGAGTVSASDSILTAIEKLNGNTAALVTGVSSVSNSDSSITFSPTTGAVVGSLNVANPNTWAALQAFPATDFQLLDATDITKTGKFDLSTQATGTNTLFRLPTLGVTGTINLATINSVTQSFTGSTTFTSTFATNGTSSTLGGGTGAITANIGTGATLNATTKVVNVGTGGVSGSTTNIAIGSTVSGSLGTLTIQSPTMNFGANNTRIAMPDGSLRITNTADSTKQISFSATGITTATTRTWTSQDASGTVAYLSNNLGAFGATTSAQLASIISDETGTGVLAFATNPTLSGVTITDATNIVFGTTTGTKFGTATNQKISFYNATPVIQPTGDPITALTSLGFLATPTAITVPEGGTGVASLTAYAPIFGGTTSTGAVQSGTVGTTGQVLTSNGPGALPTFQPASSGAVVTFAAINGFLPSSITGVSTTATLTVSAGQAADSTNAVYISKNSTTSWAVINGNAINGYQGGVTLPNSSTLHFFMCTGGTGTGSFASASLTPTCPAGYNTSYRRIFSLNTSSLGAPIAGTAIETEGGSMIFWLTTQLLDISTSTLSTTRVAETLTVPSGIKVIPFIRATSSNAFVILTSGDESDVAPNTSAAWVAAPGQDIYPITGGGGVVNMASLYTTNTSGQIFARAGAASSVLNIVNRGFKDFRRN